MIRKGVETGMTIKERLNLIRIIQNAEPENGMFSVSVEALNEMLDVLKESIAPVLSASHLWKANDQTWHGKCPKCSADINEYDNPKYCGRCGQAVKWE